MPVGNLGAGEKVICMAAPSAIPTWLAPRHSTTGGLCTIAALVATVEALSHLYAGLPILPQDKWRPPPLADSAAMGARQRQRATATNSSTAGRLVGGLRGQQRWIKWGEIQQRWIKPKMRAAPPCLLPASILNVCPPTWCRR